MDIIVNMVFGSHLYGTDDPDSDRDFKGIFMPEPREILLGRIPKSNHLGTNRDTNRKNSPGDVDHEIYSLHYFVELACRGETVALDMLHAPKSALVKSSLTWASLVSNRERFYTKNLKALTGYARRQAAKYGVKGSRLADARVVLKTLEEAPSGTRIGDLRLEEREHCRWTSPDEKGIRYYEACGKKLQETAAVEVYLEPMRRFVENYGGRAKLAEQNKGIDWKAISHAFRAAYQVRHILVDRGFTYPLPETEVILRVKRGEVPFREASANLEELIEEVEELSNNSPLPEKVDRAYWDRWLLSQVSVPVREFVFRNSGDLRLGGDLLLGGARP